MAIRLPRFMHVKQILRRVAPNAAQSSSVSNNVPRGYIPVYVGEAQKKRYVVPISYLNEPSFQKLLSMVEEEFEYDHPMGGLTIPCRENVFTDLAFRLAERIGIRSTFFPSWWKLSDIANVHPTFER